MVLPLLHAFKKYFLVTVTVNLKMQYFVIDFHCASVYAGYKGLEFVTV